MSHIRCQVSPEICHMSLTATAKATDPPLLIPLYAQQDSAGDLDLDPSTINGADQQNNSSQRCDF